MELLSTGCHDSAGLLMVFTLCVTCYTEVKAYNHSIIDIVLNNHYHNNHSLPFETHRRKGPIVGDHQQMIIDREDALQLVRITIVLPTYTHIVIYPNIGYDHL